MLIKYRYVYGNLGKSAFRIRWQYLNNSPHRHLMFTLPVPL